MRAHIWYEYTKMIERLDAQEDFVQSAYVCDQISNRSRRVVSITKLVSNGISSLRVNSVFITTNLHQLAQNENQDKSLMNKALRMNHLNCKIETYFKFNSY